MTDFEKAAPRRQGSLHDLRGGAAMLLGCVYIAVLIPALMRGGPSSAEATTVAATAFACALGTGVFALVTRLPFAVGPGIVPASIVATYLASGISWGVVMGIELIAGLLFAALAFTGALARLVHRMPQVLKTVGQIAIGLYLFMAALRAAGITQSAHEGPPSLGASGVVFVLGLGTVFLVSLSRRWSAYAILMGLLLAAAVGAAWGLSDWPAVAIEVPSLSLQWPDLAGALQWQYADEVLILLYVVVVDVVATLETISACAPTLRDDGGQLRRQESAMRMSALVFVLSPLLGTAPMLVFFESLGGVLSGARSARAAAVVVVGFVAVMFMAPLASAVPACACAVALAYIGYTITKHAVLALPLDAAAPCLGRLGRQLASVAVVAVVVTQSLALTIFALFAVYPVAALVSGLRLRISDALVSVAAFGLVVTMWM